VGATPDTETKELPVLRRCRPRFQTLRATVEVELVVGRSAVLNNSHRRYDSRDKHDRVLCAQTTALCVLADLELTTIIVELPDLWNLHGTPEPGPLSLDACVIKSRHAQSIESIGHVLHEQRDLVGEVLIVLWWNECETSNEADCISIMRICMIMQRGGRTSDPNRKEEAALLVPFVMVLSNFT
jgi:hypothetical protein